MPSVEFIMNLAILVGMFSIAILGLNIIMGFCGQPWLGNAALVGVGGYTAAILATSYHFSFWLALPISVAITTLTGVGVGLPALRLNEDFLAIATIGFNFAIQAFFNYTPYFGGFAGIVGIPYPSSFESFLLLVFVILAVLIIVNKIVASSWVGLAWEAIRENESTALASGINVNYFKLLAFALGSAYAGVCGTLEVFYFTSITPSSLGFDQSIIMVAAAVVGGLGTIIGPLFGAALITLLPDFFQFVSNYRLLIFGLVIVLILLFEPHGVFGKGSYIRRAISRLRSS